MTTTTTITTITRTTGADERTTETSSSSSISNTATLIPIPVPVPVPVLLPIPIPYPLPPPPLLCDPTLPCSKPSPFVFPYVPSVLAKLSPFSSSLPAPHPSLPSPVSLPSPLPPPSPYPDTDSDSDSDSPYTPSSRFSSFSSSSPPLPHLVHLPSEIVYLVSSFLCIPSLLTMASLTRSLTLELSCVDFWKFTFISRWGHHYQVDHDTRVSASMAQIVGVMKSSSAFVWNAIEFSYSEGLRGGVEGRMTALVPNTVAPGLEGGEEPPEANAARVRGRRRRGVASGRRANKCSELTHPLVRSLICPRDGDSAGERRVRTKAWLGCRQWKVACIVRASKGVDEVELRRCVICNELDVYTSVMREQEVNNGCIDHGNTSWLSPCSCGTFTHRQCLESIIISNHLSETEALRCDVCASPYHVSQRLPLSIMELLWATWRDRGWLSEKFITVALPVYLLSLVSIFVLENARLVLRLQVFPAPFLDVRDVSAVRSPLPVHYLFLVWHHLLICILFSSRFHSTVSRIYYTPLYIFYLKLYLVMLASFIAFFFSFIAAPLPSPLQSFASSLSSSPVFTAAAVLNGGFYLITSSILIFLFWKTEYRVQTLRGEGGRGGVGEGRIGDDEAEGGEWVDEMTEHEHDQQECLTCGLVHFRSHIPP